MVKKKNAEQDVGLVRMFNDMKKKHPDALLLFRNGNFYEMYKEDALKASVILALKVSDKILPLENDPIKLLTFPRHELDKHLRKRRKNRLCRKSLPRQSRRLQRRNLPRK